MRVYNIVQSVKGGCGKTTFSIMLAGFLGKKENRDECGKTCLVDADFQGTSLIHLFIHDENQDKTGPRKCYLNEKMRRYNSYKGYFILSSKLKEIERESVSPLKILLESKIDEVYVGVEKKLVKNIKKNISYYLELYFWMMIIKNLNQNEKDKEIIKDFCSGLGKLYTKNFCSKDLIEIIKDCFRQFGKMYLRIEETDIIPDEYYTVFEASDYTYGSIQRYILPDNNWPIKMLKTYAAKDIDCYTDLYFFSYLEDKYQEYNNNSVVSRRLTP